MNPKKYLLVIIAFIGTLYSCSNKYPYHIRYNNYDIGFNTDFKKFPLMYKTQKSESDSTFIINMSSNRGLSTVTLVVKNQIKFIDSFNKIGKCKIVPVLSIDVISGSQRIVKTKYIYPIFYKRIWP